ASRSENLPSGQSVQKPELSAPVSRLEPGWHFTHVSRTVAFGSEPSPATHSTHESGCPSGAKKPASHCVHCVSASLENLPLLHVRHDSWPNALWYVPALHDAHSDAPEPEILPGSHSMHADCSLAF